MKQLVVFYTRTGTTKRIGEEIAAALGADVDEIVDQKSRKGPIRWLKAGRDAMQQNLTDITIQQSPEDYDVIIIGTPIWSGKMTPAVRTYLTNYQFTNKKVAFFTTQDSDDAVKTMIEMESMVPSSEVIGTLSIKRDDAKTTQYKASLQAFIEQLKHFSH